MTRTALRQLAKDKGLRTFEDPKGCKRGHTTFRTSNMYCVTCDKMRGVNGGSFAAWVRDKRYTDEQLAAALAAWVAAGGPSPNKEHEIMRLVRAGRWPGVTSNKVAKHMVISHHHARVLITKLAADGKLYRTDKTDGRAPIWKEVK